MFIRSLLVGLWLACVASAVPADYSLRDFQPHSDGRTDNLTALRTCFAAAVGGGTVVIPPVDFAIAAGEPALLSSHVHVIAQGARFHLPADLPDKARMVVFRGVDLIDLDWQGGHFIGHCFDWRSSDPAWPPNANSRMIVVTTSPGCTTKDLSFRGLFSEGVAGVVVTVNGASAKGSESAILTYPSNISVCDCMLERSGKFMWDYGLLWQITVWPEGYDERERALASAYFRNDLIRAVHLDEGDHRVLLPAGSPPPPVSASGQANQAVCFSAIPCLRTWCVVDSTSSSRAHLHT